MSERAHLLIAQFKQHGVTDVQPSQSLQCRGRHDNLSSMQVLHAILIGEHHRVASELVHKVEGQSAHGEAREAFIAKSKECLISVYDREVGEGRREGEEERERRN